MKNTKDINTYISEAPKEVQGLLRQMRATIKKAAPKAEEAIRYGMPTFRLNDKNLVHFATFRKHIGFYPTPTAITAFKKELAGYTTSKGAIQFPLDKKLPLELVARITTFRVKEESKN